MTQWLAERRMQPTDKFRCTLASNCAAGCGLLVSPLRTAYRVIAAALCKFSLRIKLDRCFSMVLTLNAKARAMTLLESPTAIRANTWRSRNVMLCALTWFCVGSLPKKYPDKILLATALHRNCCPAETARIADINSARFVFLRT